MVFSDTARIRTLRYKFVWGTHKSMTYSHKVMTFNTHDSLAVKIKKNSCNTLLRYKTISITSWLFSMRDVSCSYAVVVRSKASFEPSRSLLLLLFRLFLAKTYWLRYDLFKCCHFEYNLKRNMIRWRSPNTPKSPMQIKRTFQFSDTTLNWNISFTINTIKLNRVQWHEIN